MRKTSSSVVSPAAARRIPSAACVFALLHGDRLEFVDYSCFQNNYALLFAPKTHQEKESHI